MKIGYASGCYKQNKLLTSAERNPVNFGSASGLTMPRLFPGDDYARIDIFDPDISLCNDMDILIVGNGAALHEPYIEWADSVTCKKLLHLEGGYDDFTKWPIGVEQLQCRAMELSDYVMCVDYRYISLFQMWTNTEIMYWPLPYPVHNVLDILSEPETGNTFDIVVLYGPRRVDRNGMFMSRLAHKILSEVDGYSTVAIFSWSGAGTPEFDLVADTIYRIGFKEHQLTVFPVTGVRRFIEILRGAKLVINLDNRRAWGKIAIETALCKVPLIASNVVPCNYAIYGDIRVQDPYDVNATMDTARMIIDGRWSREWIDRAYNKVLHYAIPAKAIELENIINGC